MDTYTRDTMKTRIDNNLRAVAGHGGVQLRIEAVHVNGDSAFVTTCAYDTVVIFDIEDPANSFDDIVYDDSVGSGRVAWELRQIDNVWRIYSGTTLVRMDGHDLCGF